MAQQNPLTRFLVANADKDRHEFWWHETRKTFMHTHTQNSISQTYELHCQANDDVEAAYCMARAIGAPSSAPETDTLVECLKECVPWLRGARARCTPCEKPQSFTFFAGALFRAQKAASTNSDGEALGNALKRDPQRCEIYIQERHRSEVYDLARKSRRHLDNPSTYENPDVPPSSLGRQ